MTPSITTLTPFSWPRMCRQQIEPRMKLTTAGDWWKRIAKWEVRSEWCLLAFRSTYDFYQNTVYMLCTVKNIVTLLDDRHAYVRYVICCSQQLWNVECIQLTTGQSGMPCKRRIISPSCSTSIKSKSLKSGGARLSKYSQSSSAPDTCGIENRRTLTKLRLLICTWYH